MSPLTDGLGYRLGFLFERTEEVRAAEEKGVLISGLNQLVERGGLNQAETKESLTLG